MKQMLLRLSIDKSAVTAIEYALIAAFIAVVIVGGVGLLGTNLSSIFSNAANSL